MNGKKIKLQRLFSNDENAVIIAIDHGLFDGPIPGIININETVKKINPSVDGVLLSPGMLPICKNLFNFKGAPMPIVRINWSGVYCFHWNYNKAYTVVTKSVKDALAEGAEIVLISLTIGTGDEERDAMNVQVYSKLMNEAKRYGIPVIGEFFPINSDKLTADEMHERVFSSCRILSEIGADLIKTFYTQEFKKVTNSTPIPILGLGADKKPTQLEALQLAYDEISDGAKGVVFGRNAINVADPFSFQAALIDVVKRMETPEIVADKYNLW